MSAGTRVLIIETVVPDAPGPHLSKALDIAMMALSGGMERSQEGYASLAAKCALRLGANGGDAERIFSSGNGRHPKRKAKAVIENILCP